MSVGELIDARLDLLLVALCRGGRYSPLETIWVGIGVAAEAASAPATRRCSRSLSQLPSVPPSLLEIVKARSSFSQTAARGRLRQRWLGRPATQFVLSKSGKVRLQAIDRAGRSGRTGVLHAAFANEPRFLLGVFRKTGHAVTPVTRLGV